MATNTRKTEIFLLNLYDGIFVEMESPTDLSLEFGLEGENSGHADQSSRGSQFSSLTLKWENVFFTPSLSTLICLANSSQSQTVH